MKPFIQKNDDLSKVIDRLRKQISGLEDSLLDSKQKL